MAAPCHPSGAGMLPLLWQKGPIRIPLWGAHRQRRAPRFPVFAAQRVPLQYGSSSPSADLPADGKASRCMPEKDLPPVCALSAGKADIPFFPTNAAAPGSVEPGGAVSAANLPAELFALLFLPSGEKRSPKHILPCSSHDKRGPARRFPATGNRLPPKKERT